MPPLPALARQDDANILDTIKRHGIPVYQAISYLFSNDIVCEILFCFYFLIILHIYANQQDEITAWRDRKFLLSADRDNDCVRPMRYWWMWLLVCLAAFNKVVGVCTRRSARKTGI
jgi:hypothetical protein